MIKLHPVKLSLFISAASLALFVGFGALVNTLSHHHQEDIRDLKDEYGHSAERLEITQRQKMKQKRRADSLEVIVEASRRPELLWTARAIYSETRRPEEMWFVGWVIRNRVESRFHGHGTYKDIILHPKQFSAFNRGSGVRGFYMNLSPSQGVERPRWHDAMQTAKGVVDSPLAFNPLPHDTYHFYSEVSMRGRKHPEWRDKLTPVSKTEVPGLVNIEETRFRFFRGTHMNLLANKEKNATSTAR